MNLEPQGDASPPEIDEDALRLECGVFGVFGDEAASALTALGLHALQHRGQESAGTPLSWARRTPMRLRTS